MKVVAPGNMNWSDSGDRWPCRVCGTDNGAAPDWGIPYSGWCSGCGALSSGDGGPAFKQVLSLWRVEHPKSPKPMFTSTIRRRLEEYLRGKNNPDPRLIEIPLYAVGSPAASFDRTPPRDGAADRAEGPQWPD